MSNIVVKHLSGRQLPPGLPEAFERAGCPSRFDFEGGSWVVLRHEVVPGGEYESLDLHHDENDPFSCPHLVGTSRFVGNGEEYNVYYLSPLENPMTVAGAADVGVWLDNIGSKVAQQFFIEKRRSRAIDASPEARVKWLEDSGLFEKTEWYKKINK